MIMQLIDLLWFDELLLCQLSAILIGAVVFAAASILVCTSKTL